MSDLRTLLLGVAAGLVTSVAAAQTPPPATTPLNPSTNWFTCYQAGSPRSCTPYMVNNVLTSSQITSVLGYVPLGSGTAAGGALSGTYPNPSLASGAAAANLGYTPVNRAGDTMSGNLNVPNLTAPYITLTPGSAPGSLVNGQIWTTSTGVYAQVNGSTLLLGSSGTAGVDSFNTRVGAVTLLYADVVAALAYTPVNKAGDTMTGGLNVASTLQIQGAAGTTRVAYFDTGGAARWAVDANNTAESGANTGSDFAIGRFSDAGAYLDNPIQITRSNGTVTIADALGVGGGANLTGGLAVSGGGGFSVNGPTALTGNATLSGNLTLGSYYVTNGAAGSTTRAYYYQTSGVNRWLTNANQTAESGGNSGSDWAVCRFNDSGTFVDCPVTIIRSTGTAYFPDGVSISNSLGVTGGINTTGGMTLAGGFTLSSGGLTLPSGSVAASYLASGAAVSNLGYTPVNKAGDTATALNITPSSTPASNAAGYLGLPQAAHNSSYTAIIGDAGDFLYHTDGSAYTWTIPPNGSVPFPIGTVITLVNDGSGVITLAGGSGVTLVWSPSGSTGSRSLAQYALVTVMQVATDRWFVTGTGLS